MKVQLQSSTCSLRPPLLLLIGQQSTTNFIVVFTGTSWYFQSKHNLIRDIENPVWGVTVSIGDNVEFSCFRSAEPSENIKIPQVVIQTLSPIDTPYWIFFLTCQNE